MGAKTHLGEFEQMVLLAILQRESRAYGYEVRKELEENASRSVSKGAFYTTLDRLESKGYLTWKSEPVEGRRGGLPQRLFRVTPEGLNRLRKSREALLRLWKGLDHHWVSP